MFFLFAGALVAVFLRSHVAREGVTVPGLEQASGEPADVGEALEGSGPRA